MKKFLSLFVLFGCLFTHSFAQDSTIYGRSFLGLDISPFTEIFLQQQEPVFSLQYKRVLSNPCLRLRFTANSIKEKGKNLIFSKHAIERDISLHGFNDVVSTGEYQASYAGFGLEKVVPLRNFNFLYGADLNIGRRKESNTIKTAEYRYEKLCDTCQTILVLKRQPDGEYYTESHHSYTSLQIGVAPFIALEVEVGERLSFLASFTAEAKYNKLRKLNSDNTFLTKNTSVADFSFSRIGLVMFYRF